MLLHYHFYLKTENSRTRKRLSGCFYPPICPSDSNADISSVGPLPVWEYFKQPNRKDKRRDDVAYLTRLVFFSVREADKKCPCFPSSSVRCSKGCGLLVILHVADHLEQQQDYFPLSPTLSRDIPDLFSSLHEVISTLKVHDDTQL